MSDQHIICRLCCDTVKEKDVEVITECLRGMLQSTLTKIDLAISENPVICSKCLEKLEANYYFKRKCVFTEDCITPFVVENVKLNLKEVRNQIIKSEDIDNDKNVCRLCLQFVDNDMTLSDCEKKQLQQFFPEINLSRTNFVILCSTCYDLLQQYFVFVTSFFEQEQQLCNYSLDHSEHEIDITEEHVGIKLENFKEFIKNIQEKKELEVKEELVMKYDIAEDDARYEPSSQEHEQALILKKEELDFGKVPDENEKEFESNEILKGHMLTTHTDSSKITWFQCKQCNKKFKRNHILKRHVLDIHTDPSKITWYQCEQCDKKFKHNYHLKNHVMAIHTNPSKLLIPVCEQCGEKFKYLQDLRSHLRAMHIDSLEITWYHCEQCDKKFKYRHHLKSHVLSMHTDPSDINWHQCEQCNKKFKHKEKLKMHIRILHTDPSKITWYQCEYCDKKFKDNRGLKSHIGFIHTDPSKITWYCCEHCDKKFKTKEKLKKHVTIVHSDPSKIIWFPCEQCSKQFKENYVLKRHMLSMHTDLSKMTWHQCEQCDKKFKHNHHLKSHVLTRHRGA